MKKIFNISLKLIIILICFLMIKRIYINLNKNKIFGSDKYMLKIKDNRYCAGKFDFINLEKFNRSYEITKINIKNFLKNNKIKFIDEKNKIYYDKKMKVDDILFKYELDIETIFDNVEYNKKLPLFYVYDKSKLCCYIIFDHRCSDLITAFRYTELFDFKPTKNMKGIDYNYIPFYNEFIFIITCFINFFKLYFTKKNYSIDKKNINLKTYQYNNNFIKNLRNKYDLKSTLISLSLSIHKIFCSSKIKINNLIVGILIGYKNKKFNNNYSILCLKIKYSLELDDIIKNIKKEMKYKFTALGSYDLLKYYTSFEKMLKTKIDLFYTNMFNYNELYNSCIKETKIIINNLQVPFYITSSSQNNYTNITIQYQTNNFIPT